MATQTQRIDALESKLDKLIGALEGKVAPKQEKGKSRKAKQEPRTIKNPAARASVKQVYLVAAKLHEAVYGEPLPNPLTMGDVQTILDNLS